MLVSEEVTLVVSEVDCEDVTVLVCEEVTVVVGELVWEDV